MWCLPLQCLYGFLSRLGTIFGHGSAGVEPLICLTCNILHRLRQVICIHLPLDENIFHKVSFNSKCWIKFTYDLHSPFLQVLNHHGWISFWPPRHHPFSPSSFPTALASRQTWDPFFRDQDHPNWWMFNKYVAEDCTVHISTILEFFFCLNCISQVFDSRLPHSRAFDIQKNLKVIQISNDI